MLPLNNESRKFLNRERLALLKEGGVVVNVARGGIIDTDALVAELNSGRIFAGLDVTDPEPLPQGHLLWNAKNCIITPTWAATQQPLSYVARNWSRIN